jgi:hypothetical protein
MGKEPQKMLLKLGDIKAWLGVSEYEIGKAVEQGLIKRIRLNENAVGRYLKDDVKNWAKGLD